MMTHEPADETDLQPIGPQLHVAWSSDRFGTAGAPVFDLADGSCAWLAALPDGSNPGRVHQLLRDAMRKPPETAQQLRLVLMRVMREIHPRPEGLAAALTRPGQTLVATTPGASAVLVRGTQVIDRAVDAVVFETQEHDRIALLCNKLDPLLGDADELGRIIGADDPHSTAVTLVEVGHLRGGGSDLCAVVAVVGGDELDDVTEDTGSFAVDDLLSALAPTLDGLQREPTPPPAPRAPPQQRSRRRLTRREVVPRAASMGAPLQPAVAEVAPTDDAPLPPPSLEEDDEEDEDDPSHSGPISESLSGPVEWRPEVQPPPIAMAAPRPVQPQPPNMLLGLAAATVGILLVAAIGVVLLLAGGTP